MRTDKQAEQYEIKGLELPFNPKPPTWLHVDLNSCFASIEQQADHKLRGRPIAVAAYATGRGCIVAPSIEAKRYGVKVGHRVNEGKLLCPDLVVIEPDPAKYRAVHQQFRNLFSKYTEKLTPKSIDEFILNVEGYPCYKWGMEAVALDIKKKIKEEIGDWLRVSIGIAPNCFLAKTAAGLNKPDGLDVIDINNYQKVYESLELMDLCGIKLQNATRLKAHGVHTVMDFYVADVNTLKRAFQSVNGYYWHLRLRGWEIDDVVFGRNSYGNSYALPDTRVTPDELSPLLMKLVEKMGRRLRKGGYACQGVHVSIGYRDGYHWHKGKKTDDILFDSRDIYKYAFKIMCSSPHWTPVRALAVSCFNLAPYDDSMQLTLFEDKVKKKKLVEALDKINSRWGDYIITPALMLGTESNVPDRIAFGGVKELEEIIIK